MPNVPAPPNTPKGGIHSKVDVASLAERAKDEAHDAKKIAMHSDDRSAEAFTLAKKHADMIERLPAIETKLDLALKPTAVSPAMRAAAYVAAIALVAIALALVTLIRTSAASASSSSGPAREAVYRVLP